MYISPLIVFFKPVGKIRMFGLLCSSMCMLWGCTHTLSIGFEKRKSTEIGGYFFKDKRWNSHLTGLSIYDPLDKTWLFEHQADKYFLPASNMKLFTYYSALQLLGDSIPTLAYWQQADTLFFTMLGDPSFLHAAYPFQPAYQFLAQSPRTLVYISPRTTIPKYGPGWAWDDDSYAFQAEKSMFSIYGNVVRIRESKNSARGFSTVPPFFSAFVESDVSSHRHASLNMFFYDTQKPSRKEVRLPFHHSEALALRLLSDTLGRSITAQKYAKVSSQKPSISLLYGRDTQRLYQHMLRSSNNFVAEQLLIACAYQRQSAPIAHLDGSSLQNTRSYVLKDHLSFLSHPPIWVDGSGLSRYNLATPRSLVELLERLYKEEGIEALQEVLAVGGQAGTLSRWDFGQAEPFVYAKTGTLSNHYALSGFLQTASGRWLIFSFMHAYHTQALSTLKEDIKDFLIYVRNKY